MTVRYDPSKSWIELKERCPKCKGSGHVGERLFSDPPRRPIAGIYCSPACGNGCTWEAYQRALLEADKLVARLSPRWRPVVWENMGWHYKAELPTSRRKYHGHIYIYPEHGTKSYWASYGSFTGEGKTPRAALRALTVAIEAEASHLSKILGIIYGP